MYPCNARMLPFFFMIVSLVLLITSTVNAQELENKPATANIPPINLEPPTAFERVRDLRNSGQLEKAKSEALSHLQQHPEDVDVLLLLGEISYQEGKYTEAQTIARKILMKVPTYVDARLLLIKVQMLLKENEAALVQVKEGLKLSPNNNDLKKIATILENYKKTSSKQTATVTKGVEGEKKPSVAKSQVTYKSLQLLKNSGQLTKAKYLALQYLQSNPKDGDVMLVLGSIYYQEKNFPEAKKMALKIIKNYPKYTDARMLLIRTEMALNHPEAALIQVKIGLKYANNNKDLKNIENQIRKNIKLPVPPEMAEIDAEYKLRQKCANEIAYEANCFYIYKQYHRAAAVSKEALIIDPQNKKAKGVLADVNSISGKYKAGLNEMGYYIEHDHVSDLGQWWDYSSLYLTHHGVVGDVNAFVNFAQRRGIKGTQEEILVSPVLDKNSHMDFDVAYSDEYNLFPRFLARVEGYYAIPKFLEFSVGEQHSDINKTYYSYTTWSVTKEFPKVYISFREYHFVPKAGERSTLNVLNLRRYLGNDNDRYIWATLGAGKSPDLNDLLTVSFIVIKNDFIFLGFHFPILNNTVAFNIAGDYQHQVFPTGRVRELMGGIFGIKIRF